MSDGHQPSPLPGGEREGPAPPFAAWEGEGGLRHRTAVHATTRARALRAASTDAERKLWSIVRGSQIGDCKFRRQVPIGRYIADFVCPRRKLIIEVDGGQHTVDSDAARTAFLEAQGYRVIRFWNGEVLTNAQGVWRTISDALAQTTPTRAARAARLSTSPLQGEVS